MFDSGGSLAQCVQFTLQQTWKLPLPIRERRRRWLAHAPSAHVAMRRLWWHGGGPVGGRQGDQADDYREDRVVDHPGDPEDYGGAYLDDRGVEDYSWCFPVQMPIRI